MTEDGIDVVFSEEERAQMTDAQAKLVLRWIRFGTDRVVRWACTAEPGQYLYRHADAPDGAWHRYVIEQAQVMLKARGLALVDNGVGLIVAGLHEEAL